MTLCYPYKGKLSCKKRYECTLAGEFWRRFSAGEISKEDMTTMRAPFTEDKKGKWSCGHFKQKT